MALAKAIPSEFGVDASYWNIGAVQEDFKGKGCEVTLYGYTDVTARQGGKQPLSAGKVRMIGNDYIAGATRTQLYDYIKTQDPFIGAADC